MKSLKNRILSGAMAGVLALSLTVPALAKETEITAVYQDPNIEVTVTTTGEAIINPYGLDLTVGGAAISGQKIVSSPVSLENKTGMNLQVGATVTGTIKAGSDMRFSEESAADSASKSAYVYVQATQTTLTGATAAAADIQREFGAWAPSAYNAETDVIVSDRGGSTENLVVLKAADMSGQDGAFAAYKSGSVGLVRLSGDCPTSPRDAWDEEKDGFTVNIAYTFTPVTFETHAITVDLDNFTATGSGVQKPTSVTPDVTTAAEGDLVTVTVVQNHKNDSTTLTVKDAANNPVTVSAGVKDTSDTNELTYTFTFTMPASAVTITGAVTG